MNHRPLLHAGCLLAATLLFSGCVAEKQAEPAKQTQATAKKKVVITPDEEVVIVPSEEPAAAKPKAAPKQAAKPKPQPAPATVEAAVAPQPAAAAPASGSPLEHYGVTLSSNKTSVAQGETLSLKVLVDAPQYPISGSAQHGVQITFSGLDFVAEAPTVECLRAHPSGSEIIYILTAMKPGTFDVTANVAVFPTRDCETFNIQRTSTPVTIDVK